MLLTAASFYAPLVSAGLLLAALVGLAPQLGLTAQGVDSLVGTDAGLIETVPATGSPGP